MSQEFIPTPNRNVGQNNNNDNNHNYNYKYSSISSKPDIFKSSLKSEWPKQNFDKKEQSNVKVEDKTSTTEHYESVDKNTFSNLLNKLQGNIEIKDR